MRVKNKFTKPVLIHLPPIAISQSPGIKHSDFSRLSSGECKKVDSFRDEYAIEWAESVIDKCSLGKHTEAP